MSSLFGLLATLGIVAVFANSAHALSCYVGDENKTTFVENDEWKYCVMTKNVETKKFTYWGYEGDESIRVEDCYIKYDYTNDALNVHCYCSKEHCNVPGTFNPRY